ncbi:monooxygenase [Kosakonia sp. 1610]|uniref:monooxygenase n=1 Tax=Kosakonia sp. 1610 TaxID=3156426 RepID=UPI003D1AE0A6
MAKKLVQINFDFNGPFGDEMSQQLVELAESINQEPGFLWKVWTENALAQEAGGIYLFDSEANAQRYMDKHMERLKQFGATNITVKLFDVNEPLTRLNHGRLG